MAEIPKGATGKLQRIGLAEAGPGVKIASSAPGPSAPAHLGWPVGVQART